ncbi:transcriptional regulator, ArsR family [Actinomadura meyerae]|jgi:DNA-binding transcriptional ArsR family regulator|uniref:Transcriptional regulator, ArsR family n=1 Tax=Actinomadura meyerae TaxID=240840 RepID=A0A239LVJ1_9ACTN|nr:metalloregulator ArsR/SmtB family transcription factor [Actinomadura meyerae]SNT34687.1 transcriptional regulator, ArsR family [Actinomadura meyerae]
MTDDDASKVTDSRVLAAMSHPLRRRLLDVLKVYGPATASALAGRTDQAVANISHHLKVLGAAGLIVEAPELAKDRRERWWRLAEPELRWVTGDFDDDPARQAVAGAAASLALDRQVGLVRAWHAVREERQDWNGAAFSVDTWLHLTPAELGEFERELLALLGRWEERAVPDDGRQREPVFFFAHGVPAQP